MAFKSFIFPGSDQNPLCLWSYHVLNQIYAEDHTWPELFGGDAINAFV